MLGAIILAAGYGTRIGQPKWQLIYKNKTFLEIIIENLLDTNIKNIVAVFNSDTARKRDMDGIKEKHKNNIENNKIQFVINHTPENGMISSIYYGVQTLPNVNGFFIIPVDHPFATQSTYKILADTFLAHKEKVIRPQYRNKSGHPIIIPTHLAKEIPNQDINGGLKQFLLQKNATIINIPVEDKGILRNINTKEDLYE